MSDETTHIPMGLEAAARALRETTVQWSRDFLDMDEVASEIRALDAAATLDAMLRERSGK